MRLKTKTPFVLSDEPVILLPRLRSSSPRFPPFIQLALNSPAANATRN